MQIIALQDFSRIKNYILIPISSVTSCLVPRGNVSTLGIKNVAPKMLFLAKV